MLTVMTRPKSAQSELCVRLIWRTFHSHNFHLMNFDARMNATTLLHIVKLKSCQQEYLANEKSIRKMSEHVSKQGWRNLSSIWASYETLTPSFHQPPLQKLKWQPLMCDTSLENSLKLLFSGPLLLGVKLKRLN